MPILYSLLFTQFIVSAADMFDVGIFQTETLIRFNTFDNTGPDWDRHNEMTAKKYFLASQSFVPRCSFSDYLCGVHNLLYRPSVCSALRFQSNCWL